MRTVTFDEIQARHTRYEIKSQRLIGGGRTKAYAYCQHDEQPWPCDTMVLAVERETARGVVIHRCPPKGSGFMPCCGLPPFERLADRITLDRETVTCHGVSIGTTSPEDGWTSEATNAVS